MKSHAWRLEARHAHHGRVPRSGEADDVVSVTDPTERERLSTSRIA